jgi:hypothetical protein
VDADVGFVGVWDSRFERVAEIYRIVYGDASLADTYDPNLRVGTCKRQRRHTFSNVSNWHKLKIQRNSQNGRSITKADPLRQGEGGISAI